MRPTCFAVLLAALGPPATALAAQTSPIGLAGFTLGRPGGEAPARAQCTPSPTEADCARCRVGDSVTVWLSRDTIVGVLLMPQVPRRYRSSTRDVLGRYWDRELSVVAERLFGPPAGQVLPFPADTSSTRVATIPAGKAWDLLTDGHGLMANWPQHHEAGWEARVAVGKLYFYRAPRIEVLTRAEVTVACAGRLFRLAAPDSSGVPRPVAPAGPTASCPRAP
jgi:hypothetical protein